MPHKWKIASKKEKKKTRGHVRTLLAHVDVGERAFMSSSLYLLLALWLQPQVKITYPRMEYLSWVELLLLNLLLPTIWCPLLTGSIGWFKPFWLLYCVLVGGNDFHCPAYWSWFVSPWFGDRYILLEMVIVSPMSNLSILLKMDVQGLIKAMALIDGVISWVDFRIPHLFRLTL